MESETLFTEEAEPPGKLAGLDGIEKYTNDILSSYNTLLTPSVAQTRGAPYIFRFKESPQSRAFRKRFYPETTSLEWSNWHWQYSNRIRDVHTLSQFIWLSEDERKAMDNQAGSLPVAITPFYASLLNEFDPHQPVRRMVVPVTAECRRTEGEADDPLGEEHDSPVPGIVHRYPDRVLFLVTDTCSTYCRYCTRSRMVGSHRKSLSNTDAWEGAIAYIAANPQIRDVLLSGGDPLTLSDERLEWLLTRLRKIPHIEILRIGTKVPVVMPQRITPKLTLILKRFHPLWISIHANHPDELTPEMNQACIRLANAGIPLGSQTVLLHKINDDVETMKQLVLGLLKVRVKPYYLYQCDPIPGSSHFRTPVKAGLDIIEGLRGHTTGYAVPTYVIDAPGGGGKIPLLPEYLIGQDGNDLLLRNYEGNIYRYPDCRLSQADNP
ncbi:MAG TPA: KamA family radical SAM protein [Syntrophales bacterium]|nr:KamA family radical SAM protein [Syntrophales bacterium]